MTRSRRCRLAFLSPIAADAPSAEGPRGADRGPMRALRILRLSRVRPAHGSSRLISRHPRSAGRSLCMTQLAAPSAGRAGLRLLGAGSPAAGGFDGLRRAAGRRRSPTARRRPAARAHPPAPMRRCAATPGSRRRHRRAPAPASAPSSRRAASPPGDSFAMSAAFSCASARFRAFSSSLGGGGRSTTAVAASGAVAPPSPGDSVADVIGPAGCSGSASGWWPLPFRSGMRRPGRRCRSRRR